MRGPVLFVAALLVGAVLGGLVGLPAGDGAVPDDPRASEGSRPRDAKGPAGAPSMAARAGGGADAREVPVTFEDMLDPVLDACLEGATCSAFGSVVGSHAKRFRLDAEAPILGVQFELRWEANSDATRQLRLAIMVCEGGDCRDGEPLAQGQGVSPIVVATDDTALPLGGALYLEVAHVDHLPGPFSMHLADRQPFVAEGILTVKAT